jgi:hypothetical protein
MYSMRTLFVALVLVAATVVEHSAQAREPEECQLAWGQAVRSYLTQNRTKGPEDSVFAPACQLEAEGKKDEARVEAAIIGVKALAQLDPKGCQRFMESYMSSNRPKDVCDTARGDDVAALRKLIMSTIPARPQGKK